MGYRCSLKILNAADYGVPQNRNRMFAVFSNQDTKFINLNNLIKSEPVGWYEATKDLINDLVDTYLTDKQLMAVINHHDYCGRYLLVERVGYYDEPKIRNANQPCWCLRSHLANDGHGGNGRSNIINIVTPDGTTKKVNTKVLARLQSFPDDFIWSDKFVDNVTVIGNAIAPDLMRQICELIK